MNIQGKTACLLLLSKWLAMRKKEFFYCCSWDGINMNIMMGFSMDFASLTEGFFTFFSSVCEDILNCALLYATHVHVNINIDWGVTLNYLNHFHLSSIIHLTIIWWQSTDYYYSCGSVGERFVLFVTIKKIFWENFL